MKSLFDQISYQTSRNITRTYSTSFSLGIRFLHPDLQKHIYNLYGYVRVADEIVDTFHEFDKETILDEFREETYKALERGISTNPVINSFQETVLKYNIPRIQIEQFLHSMEMDLNPGQIYDQKKYEEYILGSAEVVGLMCLKVFLEGDEKMYEDLKPHAMSLGSAFQKINFLRDLQADYNDLGRTYFPGVDFENFTEADKMVIEKDIEKEFDYAYEGILKLPKKSRFGVYIAYIYYRRLHEKIKHLPASKILNERVRISDNKKYSLFFSSYLRHSLNLI